MTQLLSFHGDKKIKEKYVNRLRAHAKADELIKGKYWEGGKGCAVGCTIHSSEHVAYETQLGIPEWLARLEDALFEGLPNGHAKKFAVDFLNAVPVGVNLESLKWKFCSFILSENLERVELLKIDKPLKDQVLAAVKRCKAVHDKAIETGKWNESATAAASAAESAAESAAWAAESAAARSAARSAAWIRYAKKLIQLLRKAA
jgi:hypothetical protein